jgi:EpsI family protein
MTTKRLATLLLLLGFGLSAVFLLPAAAKNQPVGIKLELPRSLGIWYGVEQKISERELQILAPDTEFARKEYTNGRGDSIVVSIVLSGHDPDNSIHRPERCLPAQGWTIADSRTLTIPVNHGEEKLQLNRLHNVRDVPARDGRIVPVYSLDYYWFIGYHHRTASHLERTWIDIQDRLLKGYNQRWAFVTITSYITEGLTLLGRSERETDAMLEDFIQQLYPELVPVESNGN